MTEGDTGPLALEIFTPEEHGGAPISSKITEDSRGNIYVANQNGTLIFDGSTWSKLPDTGYDTYTNVVHIDQHERIWTAGPYYLGYYEKDSTGQLAYNSRTEGLLQELEGTEIGAIWEVFSDKDHLYVITSFHVAIWDGNDWSHHDLDVERRILPSYLDGRLYIHARGSGLFRIKGTQIDKVFDDSPEISCGIIRVLSDSEDHFLVTTTKNGTFEINKQPHQSDYTINKTLNERGFVYVSIPLSDGSFALGMTDEIELVGQDGAINSWESNKIGNVYHLYESADGSIWAGTTKSIVRIPPNRYSKFGTECLSLARHNKDIYVSTGTQLLRFKVEGAKADKEIIDSGSLSMNLLKRGCHLIYNTATDLKILKHGDPYLSLPVPRKYYDFNPSKYDRNVFYSLEAPEVSRWKISRNNITRINQSSDTKLLISEIIDTAPNQSLFSTFDKRLGIIDWPPLEEVGTPPVITIFESLKGVPDEVISFRLLPVGKKILLATDRGLFLHEERNHFSFLESVGSQITSMWSDLAYCPTANGAGIVIYAKDKTEPAGYVLGILHIDEDNQTSWRKLKLPGLSDLGMVRSLLHVEINGREILWVGGSKELHRYDLAHLQIPLSAKVNLRSIKETTANRLFYNGFGNPPSEPTWNYPLKSLRIDYSAPPSGLEVKGYQTNLVGFNNQWSEITELTFREYNNLSEGNYTFRVRAIDEFGRPGPVKTFTFTILPPWYRTPFAYIAYAALVFFVFLLIARLWTQHLRKRNLELENIVKQRTGELERSNMELREANSVKQDFLASMSHEIRNPLNGILGIAQLLKQDQATDATRVNHLNTCATHLYQLLGQVLDFSSLESGLLEPHPTPFNPKQLVQDVIDMHQVLAEKKGLRVEVNLQEMDHLWIGDPVLLRQILINLVSNAIKYTPEGEIRVALNYENQKNRIKARFLVEDTGLGIPEGKRDYIFKDFTRLTKAGESEIAGTGLGLAIASQISQIMHGALRIDSDYTEGARFVLELPFDQGQNISVIEAAKRDAGHQPLQGEHVLIADDMDFNRYISRELFEKLGARVTEAEDGKSALEELNRSSFDIAILDINMPKLSGNEVVRHFLEQHVGEPPLFIALTAHVNARMEQEALEAGFKQFIEKPLHPEQIIQIALSQPLPKKKSPPSDLLSYLAGQDGKSNSDLKARYLKSMRDQIKSLRSSIEKQDQEEARAGLHKLRGLANMQRKPEIMERLDGLSNSLAAPDFDAALEQVGQLESLVEED